MGICSGAGNSEHFIQRSRSNRKICREVLPFITRNLIVRFHFMTFPGQQNFSRDFYVLIDCEFMLVLFSKGQGLKTNSRPMLMQYQTHQDDIIAERKVKICQYQEMNWNLHGSNQQQRVEQYDQSVRSANFTDLQDVSSAKIEEPSCKVTAEPCRNPGSIDMPGPQWRLRALRAMISRSGLLSRGLESVLSGTCAIKPLLDASISRTMILLNSFALAWKLFLNS